MWKSDSTSSWTSISTEAGNSGTEPQAPLAGRALPCGKILPYGMCQGALEECFLQEGRGISCLPEGTDKPRASATEPALWAGSFYAGSSPHALMFLLTETKIRTILRLTPTRAGPDEEAFPPDSPFWI